MTFVKVAIVVPSLNQAAFLGQALDSVLGQDGVDLQVAVMDGGSHDGSVAVIRRYESRLSYWQSAPDRGQSAAINDGIARLQSSDYVGWLNADDVLLPGALQRLGGYLRAHPECVAVFGRAYIIDARGAITGEFPTRPFSRRALARTSIICQPATLVSRRAWEAVGGLDEALQMCLDYDLWWRLSARGPIEFIPEFLACSRDHANTKTRARQDRLYEEVVPLLLDHLGRVPWSWSLSESAYRWRASHGGQRATTVWSQALCGGRALLRHAEVNGASGLARGLRDLWVLR